jgi:hypothetical protein
MIDSFRSYYPVSLHIFCPRSRHYALNKKSMSKR